MRTGIFRSKKDLDSWTARAIAEVIKEKPQAVFTFATGGTPEGAYEELVRLATAEGLDFSRATAFHLDEYVGLRTDHEQSYQRYLKEKLFNHLQFGSVHFLDGCASDLERECRRYDRMLLAKGVDLLVAGIGGNGHLAFNEPPADPDGTTHVQDLSEATRVANARFFGGNIDLVPRQAITQGLKNILDARRVLLLATDAKKAEAVRLAVEGPVTGLCPASVLQRHPDAIFLLDEAAASLLQGKNMNAELVDLPMPLDTVGAAS